MPTVVTHAIATGALGTWWRGSSLSGRLLAAGVVASVVPDLDVIGFRFGIAYGDVLGHRGLSHSVAFALLLAIVLTVWLVPASPGARVRGGLFLFLAIACHGLLDALTDGGLGVAFFAPFENGRYFLPWRPIPVSPIGGAFLSARGAAVLRAEVVWIWAPATVVGVAGTLWRRHHTRRPGAGPG